MRVGSTVMNGFPPPSRTTRAAPRRASHACFGRPRPSPKRRAGAAKTCVLLPARRGPRTRGRELGGRLVAQRAVWPGRVVLLLPLLAQHPRFQQTGELLALQSFVPQLAVERL